MPRRSAGGDRRGAAGEGGKLLLGAGEDVQVHLGGDALRVAVDVVYLLERIEVGEQKEEIGAAALSQIELPAGEFEEAPPVVQAGHLVDGGEPLQLLVRGPEVIEGVGDHCCEYMTNGTIVVIGPTGRNFAAGMNGGRAFVLDEQGDFSTSRCNTANVDLEPLVSDEDVAEVRGLLTRHRDLTGSPRATWVLEHWAEAQPLFIKVFPHEFKRVLGIPCVDAVYVSPNHPSSVVAATEVQHG